MSLIINIVCYQVQPVAAGNNTLRDSEADDFARSPEPHKDNCASD